MAEYRYYLIPDFMSHVFPQQFEEQAPTEFFSNTADLMKHYKPCMWMQLASRMLADCCPSFMIWKLSDRSTI